MTPLPPPQPVVRYEDFRHQNAADFVLRATLDLVPQAIGASAWRLTEEGLCLVTSLRHPEGELERIASFLAAVPPLSSATPRATPLPGADSLYASALMVSVPAEGPGPAGYLFLTSAEGRAFDSQLDGLAIRLAQQLGQYWSGLAA